MKNNFGMKKLCVVQSPNPDVNLYAVSVDCTGGVPVTGYLLIPKGVEKGKKYGIHVCQPSSIAVLWNNLKCPKSIVWMQGSEHGYVPPDYEGRDTVRQAK